MPPKTWCVNPLALEDCQSAAQLHQKSFFKGWKESDFREFLNNPLILGLKIEENKTLIGYLLWREVKDEAEILTLVVAASYRKKGVGSLLLMKLFDILAQKNILNLFLEVAEDNFSAQSFYIKNGFTLLGLRPNYYPRKTQNNISALNFFKSLV